MICSMWVDQERVESMCTPSNLYVVTLSTVCDAILDKGKLDDQVPAIVFQLTFLMCSIYSFGMVYGVVDYPSH